MVVVVDVPSDVSPTPSSPNGCASQSGTSRSESPRPRPGTPQRILQSLIGGRSLSPFNGLPASGSGFLRRSSSSRSMNTCDNSSKRSSMLKHEGAAKDTALPANNATASSSLSPKKVDTSPVSNQPSPLSRHDSPILLPEPPHIVSTPKQPPEPATSPVISPGISSSTSTLSVDEMEEDLISTRSASPFEDMGHSQMTTSTEASSPPEDLPEALRLMRVAHRRGIKVIDFAFEGPKSEGVIEDWAWEGGAACKGFGVGLGGGAYNGPLKKYKPIPKESPATFEEDKMVVDPPSSPIPNIFTQKPNRPKPLPSVDAHGRMIERSFNSPPPQSRNGFGSGALSQSGFLQYLQQRQLPSFSTVSSGSPTSEPSGFKRERSFVIAEQEDGGPFKKRSIG